jgi:hypothetical protein
MQTQAPALTALQSAEFIAEQVAEDRAAALSYMQYVRVMRAEGTPVIHRAKSIDNYLTWAAERMVLAHFGLKAMRAVANA